MVVELGAEVIRGTLLPRGRCAQDRPPSWLRGDARSPLSALGRQAWPVWVSAPPEARGRVAGG